MFRTIFVITLALAAAAVAVPVAQAVTDPSGRQVADPLATSYLRQQGLSPAEVKARTVGIDPLAASYIRNGGFPQAITTKAIDPLAASYLRNGGFPQVNTTKAIDPLAASYVRNGGFPQVPTETVASSAGFDWADAGIGAGATLGGVLLLGGLGAALVIARHNRRRHVASV
jgi:hypothetical protein